MDDELSPRAWVVNYRRSYSPGPFSEACASEAEAKAFAEQVTEHGDEVVSVAQEHDIAPEELYARFVERIGVETSPGVITIGWGEYRGVEVVVDPQRISKAFQEYDDHDDTNFPEPSPKAIHPRRLALDYLLFYLFDEMLPSSEDVPKSVTF